jgi:hypothetical protein
MCTYGGCNGEGKKLWRLQAESSASSLRIKAGFPQMTRSKTFREEEHDCPEQREWNCGKLEIPVRQALENPATPPHHGNGQPDTHSLVFNQHSFCNRRKFLVQMTHSCVIYTKGMGAWDAELDMNLSSSSATYWLFDLGQAISPL